jgi:Flp pilus assembly CpaE family ATPase
VSVPVLTAVTGALWESALVASLERGTVGVDVVRRCVDLADLLAAAASGQARVALLSADLRRLDRDALVRLASSGVAVVGLVTPGDEPGERRLRQLGVSRVLPADAPAERLAAAVREAGGALGEASPRALGEPRAAMPDLLDLPRSEPVVAAGEGRLVAVWGPTGAPGRTTMAVALASEAALLGTHTLLADADTYGGAVAQVLGLLDEAPGLAAAARAANSGQLDVPGLARHARQVSATLRLLTGIARPERWVELRPASLEVVWAMARSLVELTVVDCGFSLELDEELSFDTAAPRRNGATLTTLEQADTVVAVGSADPVGVQRLVRGLAELRETLPRADVRVVLNRARSSVLGSRPEDQLREAMSRYAAVEQLTVVPYDRKGCDAAILHGRALAEVATDSPVRGALEPLVADLAGRSDPARVPGWRRLRPVRA